MRWPCTLPRCLAGLVLLPGILLSTPAQSQVVSPRPPTRSVEATRPFAGYHRYRGTVGSQPVTVELTFNPTECQGTCRFDSSAARLHELLSWHPAGPRQPLQLVEADTGRLGLRTGFWQARQPAGPVLTGIWTGASGQKLHFELREAYGDKWGRLAAMPYEIVSESLLKVDSCLMTQAEWARNPKREPMAILGRQFLHFLGPDTLRAGVEALQCPPPAARQAAAWQEMQSEFGPDSSGANGLVTEYASSTAYERTCSLEVLYQGSGLLSWGDYCYYYSGGVHGGHSGSVHVYDLNEGVFLELSELLLPGAERLVSRLLMRHLQVDEAMAEYIRSSYTSTGAVISLPESGFALVENGLSFQYADYEISGYIPPDPVTLTWVELQPLLRPDSPLARMLRERGLWRQPAPTGPER